MAASLATRWPPCQKLCRSFSLPDDLPMQLTARPSGPLKADARVPGAKSISPRALILGGLGEGVTEISGLLEGDDVLATAEAMRAFGAAVERLGAGQWRVVGRGGFVQPGGPIDCGNSGTGVRLIMGAA